MKKRIKVVDKTVIPTQAKIYSKGRLVKTIPSVLQNVSARCIVIDIDPVTYKHKIRKIIKHDI